MGEELRSAVWPPDGRSRKKRFVGTSLFYPFSGPAQIAVRVGGPELADRPLEVHFDLDEVEDAELFANKCLIVLAQAHVDEAMMTRDTFYDRALQLYIKDRYAKALPTR